MEEDATQAAADFISPIIIICQRTYTGHNTHSVVQGLWAGSVILDLELVSI